MSAPWHGLHDTEWLALWDEYGWRHILKTTLVEVACCKELEVEDRLSAVNILSSAIRDGVLEPDESMPEFIIQVLLDITLGGRGRWWKRWYVRPRMKDRLRGALNLSHTGAQFIKDAAAPDLGAPLSSPHLVTVGTN